MLEIIIEIKDVYGVQKYYPACAVSQIFAGLAGTKTLTPENLQRIRHLGYKVRVKEQTLEGESK